MSNGEHKSGSRRPLPWVEKYRPKTLDDIVGNAKSIATMKALVADGAPPHLIISGPPGCGKTTAVRCMAHQLLGYDVPPAAEKAAPAAAPLAPVAPVASIAPFVTESSSSFPLPPPPPQPHPTAVNERVLFLARNESEEMRYYSNNVLEINASDESGVGVVRNVIKRFASKETTFSPAHIGRHKIVILDEADNLTKDAQQSLRRLIEMHDATTRFMLACNDSTRLIDALQSRCTVLRFQRLPEVQISERLHEIARSEHIEVDDDGINALVFRADGDMRNAINDLHTVHAAYGSILYSHVNARFDTPRPQLIAAIVECCLAQRYDEALQQLAQLISHGYSSLDILSTMYRVARHMPSPSVAERVSAAQRASSSAFSSSAASAACGGASGGGSEMTEQRKLLLLADIGQFQMRALNGCFGALQLQALVSTMCRTCAAN